MLSMLLGVYRGKIVSRNAVRQTQRNRLRDVQPGLKTAQKDTEKWKHRPPSPPPKKERGTKTDTESEQKEIQKCTETGTRTETKAG